MRRRSMARTLETEVSGSHLGKQPVANDTQTNNVGQMFGPSGLIPETGSGGQNDETVEKLYQRIEQHTDDNDWNGYLRSYTVRKSRVVER